MMLRNKKAITLLSMMLLLTGCASNTPVTLSQATYKSTNSVKQSNIKVSKLKDSRASASANTIGSYYSTSYLGPGLGGVDLSNNVTANQSIANYISNNIQQGLDAAGYNNSHAVAYQLSGQLTAINLMRHGMFPEVISTDIHVYLTLKQSKTGKVIFEQEFIGHGQAPITYKVSNALYDKSLNAATQNLVQNITAKLSN